MDDFATVMTPDEVAEFAKVGEEEVALWYRSNQLVADYRTFDGRPVAYRWRVERDVPRLAAGERVRVVRKPRGPKTRTAIMIDPRSLPCGCAFPSHADAAEVDPARPIFLCRDARALEASARLASMLAAAVPDDPMFRRVDETCRAALAAHLAGPTAPTEPEDCKTFADLIRMAEAIDWQKARAALDLPRQGMSEGRRGPIAPFERLVALWRTTMMPARQFYLT